MKRSPKSRFLDRFEAESVPAKETDGMKRSRFSEDQIIAILKQQESGVATVDVCRKHECQRWSKNLPCGCVLAQ